jgi:hypothetical protein
MKRLADLRESIIDASDIRVPRGRISIPRHQMPQIAKDDYSEYLDLMRLRGASVKQTTIPADALKAAQNEINLEKVRQWSKSMPEGAESKFCIVSSDNYVLDGNHTWLAKYHRDPKYPISCIQVGLNIEDLLNTSKLFDKATNKTVNEARMHFDEIPQSLLSKVKTILGEETKKKTGKTAEKEDDTGQDEKLSGKKEKIIINPEIRPDKMVEPYTVQTKVKS